MENEGKPDPGFPFVFPSPWKSLRDSHISHRPGGWLCDPKESGDLEQEHPDSIQRSEVHENVDTLRAQRQKLQLGVDRLIDSLAEGVIEKDQFTARMNRTKARIADIEATS